MAKIYRYLNGLNNEVEQLEVSVDNIEDYLKKLKSDERVVIPLSKNYVKTRALKFKIGYEIEEHELHLEKIVIKDREGNRIDSSMITTVNIPNRIEEYVSRDPKFLFNDFDQDKENYRKRYVVSRHNPTTIKVYFSDLVEVKEIDIYTKRRIDECQGPYCYTCLSVEYLNEELTLANEEEIWYGIEYLTEKFTPENGLYAVDFSLIEGTRLENIELPNDNSIVTMKQLNQILQDYIRQEEFSENFEEQYRRLVTDVVNEVIPLILKQLGGTKY